MQTWACLEERQWWISNAVRQNPDEELIGDVRRLSLVMNYFPIKHWINPYNKYIKWTESAWRFVELCWKLICERRLPLMLECIPNGVVSVKLPGLEQSNGASGASNLRHDRRRLGSSVSPVLAASECKSPEQVSPSRDRVTAAVPGTLQQCCWQNIWH